MEFVMWALVTFASAFIGSYLGSYLKRKGENLATHEDIGKLVDQVTAVKTATKEIEAKISSDVPELQKRREVKREVLLEATKRLAEVDNALTSLHSTFQTERINRKPEEAEWLAAKAAASERWRKAANEFDETRLLIGIACGKEVKDAFDGLGVFTSRIASGIIQNDEEIYSKSQAELAAKLFAVRAAVRKELGIDGPA